MAVGARHAVSLGQGGLGELGGHAQQARHDHPEGGARPAIAHGNGHARDITQAHGSGQGRSQSLERSHLTHSARRAVMAPQDMVGMAKHAQIDKTHAEGEIHRTDDQPGNDERHRALTGHHVEKQHLGKITVDLAQEAVQRLSHTSLSGFGQGRAAEHDAQQQQHHPTELTGFPHRAIPHPIFCAFV